MKSLLTLALAIAGLCAPVARAAPPLELYGALPNIQEAVIAPDGSAFATIIDTQDTRTLVVRNRKDNATVSFGLGDAKVRDLRWVGSEDLVLTTSQTASLAGIDSGDRRENLVGFHLNLPNRKFERLLKAASSGSSTLGSNLRGSAKDSASSGNLNTLAGLPQVRTVGGAPALFLTGVAFRSNQGVLTIFRSNLKTGQNNVVEFGGADTYDFELGADGQPLAQTTYDDRTTRWSLKLKAKVGWTEIRKEDAPLERPFLAGLGRDGQSVLIGENADKGLILREVNAEGVWSQPLEVDDADGLLFDPESRRLIGTYALVGDDGRYTFFDPADQRVWNSVVAALKGTQVDLVSWSHDRRVLIVLTDSPTEGPAYALVDMNQKSVSFIGPQYPGLTPEHISPVTPLRFKARDGMALTGYLTTPKGAARNLPLIVFPHGGPASRDAPGFDWWAQAMASRGYAVLQVNFRGSDGFGWDHMQAGFGQWGRKMQTDLSDGVAHVAAQGVIDPKRVCIVGASYGGYAALAGATLERGVYRCAVSVSGPSDLRRFVDWARDRQGRDARRYWTRFMGAAGESDPVLAEISPAAHAGKAEVPILLIHGRDDTVVPMAQSQIMADALRKAGKPVELVLQKGEDHWLSRGETRLETLRATVDFLEKHNPPN